MEIQLYMNSINIFIINTYQYLIILNFIHNFNSILGVRFYDLSDESGFSKSDKVQILPSRQVIILDFFKC